MLNPHPQEAARRRRPAQRSAGRARQATNDLRVDMACGRRAQIAAIIAGRFDAHEVIDDLHGAVSGVCNQAQLPGWVAHQLAGQLGGSCPRPRSSRRARSRSGQPAPRPRSGCGWSPGWCGARRATRRSRRAHCARAMRVHGGGWLRQEQHRRVVDQRSDQGDFLLMPFEKLSSRLSRASPGRTARAGRCCATRRASRPS